MHETPEPIHVQRRRIEFVDTDVSGNIHFSRFFVFMETAEHELLRALGTTVHLEDGDRTIGWPRVDARCRYLRPVRFGDEVEIRVFIERQGTKSMTYRFEFFCRGERVAEGEMSSVCCVLGDNGALRAIPIPEEIAGKLRAAAS
ncbi:MAG: acyl-CoA thioesterase, partial [Acidobacteriota bacterium]|nr:acyl-CoA thioesterase [Acidobacteriota bacterium]